LVRANIQLDEISLPFHRITDIGFDIIVELLSPSSFVETGKNLQTVRAINLEGNDILGETLANGIVMSPYNCSLRSLDLSGNSLSALGQINLSEMLVQNRMLYHLTASSCSFNLDGLINLTSKLRDNQALESLILAEHYPSRRSIRAV
jgi:Ran GTPase-activating protein (RanGAP) involved in mRNA processing and transport